MRPEKPSANKRYFVGPKGAPRGGYVLCPGGEISRGTPLENIEMMIKTAKKYGKYSR